MASTNSHSICKRKVNKSLHKCLHGQKMSRCAAMVSHKIETWLKNATP